MIPPALLPPYALTPRALLARYVPAALEAVERSGVVAGVNVPATLAKVRRLSNLYLGPYLSPI